MAREPSVVSRAAASDRREHTEGIDMHKIVMLLPVAGLVLAACGSPAQSAPTASATPPPVSSSAPTPTPTEDEVTVIRWIDGDTVETSAGTVRLVGIDTPERGKCGYEQATSVAEAVAPVGSVVLLVTAKQEDRDKHDRLLRYVDTPDGTDVGREVIVQGLAVARYDSRDGYGLHPREVEYVNTDNAISKYECAPAPTKKAAPSPTKTKTAEPVEEDVYFKNCTAAREAGAAPVYKGDPGYGSHLDRDGDGVACE